MPRNASGVYTLPPTNPVVPFTTIATSWANPTMSDIATALTDSLDRNGRGGMLAPFKIYDGTVSAPGLGFLNEPNLGIYRSASGVMNFVSGGATVFSIGTGITTLPAASKGAVYGEAQYRQVGQKWWRAKNVDGGLTFTPSLTIDAEDWDATKAVIFTPDGTNSSYVLKTGDTMTGGLTIATAASPKLVSKRLNNTAQANYIVGRNSDDSNIWTLGNLAGNDTVHLQAPAGNTLAIETATSSLVISGTGNGSFTFGSDIVLQKTATPGVGAIVFGNAGANLYYESGVLTFNAMNGISVTGGGYMAATTVQYTRASPVPVVVSANGTYIADWNTGLSHVISLDGATTVTPANIPVGGIVRMIVANTAAGLTVANVQWPGGTIPNFTTGPLKVAVIVVTNTTGYNFATYTVF